MIWPDLCILEEEPVRCGGGGEMLVSLESLPPLAYIALGSIMTREKRAIRSFLCRSSGGGGGGGGGGNTVSGYTITGNCKTE